MPGDLGEVRVEVVVLDHVTRVPEKDQKAMADLAILVLHLTRGDLLPVVLDEGQKVGHELDLLVEVGQQATGRAG
jgi:hypothetical protein